MAAKKKDPSDERSNAGASEESELVSLSRGLSNGKSGEAGTLLNHTTLSVWAATFILCSVLVFGLHQVRGRLDRIRAALEQSEQDKKLLLDAMDELLVRAEQQNQLLASAEPVGEEAETAPPPPAPPKQDEMEKSGPDNLATKYKIYYRTKAGEGLTQVSEKFSVSEDQLRLWNALKETDSLVPGQVLVINKCTKTDKSVAVAKAPPPPETKRVEKTEEPGPVERTGDSLAAGGAEQTPEIPDEGSHPPVDETVHVVQEGESLSTIGQQHGLSWLALAALNGIEPAETIYVGQRLKIPDLSDTAEITVPTAEVIHKVQRGENLYRIGRAYDLSWEQIARANGITDPAQLHEGQVLKIPTAKGGPEL
jgi:LysM repeat protein